METEMIEILKEVLSLHGFKQPGYNNGLLERGEIYREINNKTIYCNHINQEMMNTVDDKIIRLLKRLNE